MYMYFKREYPISKSDDHYSTLWCRGQRQAERPLLNPWSDPTQGLNIILNERETTVLPLH